MFFCVGNRTRGFLGLFNKTIGTLTYSKNQGDFERNQVWLTTD